MKLNVGWDYDDTNLYLDQQQRYTTEGLASYRHAVDKVIEEYNKNIFQKVDAPLDYSRLSYSWQSPTYYDQNRKERS